MMYRANLLIAIFILASSCKPSTDLNKNSIAVEARTWSKVDGKNIYSDWKKFNAVTVDKIAGFDNAVQPELTRYGSNPSLKDQPTGFFYTKRIGDRWWIIDPEGYVNINVSVTSVRQGGSERNKTELIKKFGSPEEWITGTHKVLLSTGFNGTGSWSDVPLVRYSNENTKDPLIYTMMWNFYSSYASSEKRSGRDIVSFDVFGPGFEQFADSHAKRLEETSSDPNLIGHFSDNELPFSLGILDEYLQTGDKTDMNYIVAVDFLSDLDIEVSDVNDSIRTEFLGVVASRYYKVVSDAMRKYDPNHLYLGSRLHGRPKNTRAIIRAISPYADIISINYYGEWEPSVDHFNNWKEWCDRPVMITEFYTKAMDSGLPNVSGAGWIVKTQEDRGVHYENFCINLLKMKNCVGWNWFRYIDNDPSDPTSDPSNNDSNKGLVDNSYNIYKQLAEHMISVNFRRYLLIDYFDNMIR